MTTQEATKQIVEDMMERARRLTARTLLEAVSSLPAEGADIQEYRAKVLATLRDYDPRPQPSRR